MTALTRIRPHKLSERGNDLYETPVEAIRALLAVERFNGRIWEPAAGRNGNIARELRRAGYDVVATDLVDYGLEDSTGRIDFLIEHRAPEGVRTILTNPPNKLAEESVRHALTLAPHVVMLLRVEFIAGQRRLRGEKTSDILDSGRLARFYPFAKRLPMMHRAGWNGPKVENSAADFAWFIWDRNHRGDALCRRLWWRSGSAESTSGGPFESLDSLTRGMGDQDVR
jgi:hypothetical protein